MKLTKIFPFIPLCACLLLAGCGKGGNANNTNTVSNTTNTTRTTNVTASPLPTAAVTHSSADNGRQAKSSTPDAAAEGLFNAWKAKDRTAAAKFASEAAVTKLFKEGGGAEGLSFQGCEKDGDSYTCGYYYEGGGLIMHVKGSETAGYRVESTEFIAD